MAYKIVLSYRFSRKLAKMFTYIENKFSLEVTNQLVERIDIKMKMACHYPGIGVPSSKIPGVYKISVSRKNKLYYRIKGRKIIMLDLLNAGFTGEE
ncbi:MAG: type II toxin-antitoxin system RelE/ParE family toxin [Chitinophagaceae bacterium]